MTRSPLPERDRAKRIRILVERNQGRAGYSFWHKGVLIARWWHNHPWIDKKMGPKQQRQWWSGIDNPKMPQLQLVQPLSIKVEERDERPGEGK